LPQAAEGSSHLVQQVLDKCSALVHRFEGLETANTAQQLEILKLKARVKKLERLNKVKGRQADKQAERYNIDLDHTSKVLSMQKDTEVQEVVEVMNAAKLITEVVTAIATTAASIPIPSAKPAVVAFSTPISAAKSAAKPKVLKIVAAAPAVLRRKRKGVLLELMLLKRSKENTKCVSVAGEELTAAKHKLELKLFRDAVAAHMK
nr:hypothetical protein [Tanacetum cinerariifolium]